MEDIGNQTSPLTQMTTHQLAIQDYKREQLAKDRHEASLEGSFSPTIETEIVDSQIADVEWWSVCPFCEYEEGRSEADRRYHEENCSICNQCGERDDECACNQFVRAL